MNHFKQRLSNNFTAYKSGVSPCQRLTMSANRVYNTMSKKSTKSSKQLKNTSATASIVVSTEPAKKSEKVLRWIAGCRDQRLIHHFDRAVHELELPESRINRTKSDGWYQKHQASHLRFYGRFAVFYRYEGTDLFILAVMGKGKNDHDYERD